MRTNLPMIRLDRKPPLALRAPKSVVQRWDRTIQSAAKPAPSQVEIAILTEIGDEMWGGFSASMMKDRLDAAAGAPVLVTLNSPGGDAFEGVAIYNLLRAHAGRVTVNVIGMAASAASVIAMAGERIEMQPGSMMMIHSAWGLVVGNQQDMRDFAEILDRLDRSVAGLYAARTGKSQDDVLELMRAETWMTAQEAKAEGFCDVAHTDKKEKPKQSAPVSPALLAASGDRPRPVVRLSTKPLPGASGLSLKGSVMQTTQERISALEAKRAATVAQMEALTGKVSDESRVMDEAEAQTFDALDADVKQIDMQLARDKRMAEIAMQTARPVTPAAGTDGAAAAAARQPGAAPARSGLRVYANIDKGIAFARYAMAMVQAEGNKAGALQLVQANRRWMDQTPQIAEFLMSAVGAGTRTGSGWADDLVYATNLVSDFVDIVRPATIVGRIPNIRRVPFNVRMGTKTSGTTGYWVGEGKPIPVSKFATGVLTLDRHKLAGLTSITEELALDSSPSAEISVRDDLRASIIELMDESFIDPDRAEVSGVSPASVTNGVTPVQPSGTDADALRADLKTLLDKFATANLSTAGGVFITTQTMANSIMFMTNALGQMEFPEFNARDGMANLRGYPVIISQSALAASSPTGGNLIIFLLPREVMLADDGEVDVRVSREASIEMESAPTQDAVAGTGAQLVSMYQNDSLAIRAIRFVSWKKRRSDAVHFINDAEYAP